MCIYKYSIRKDHPRILIVSVAEKDHTCLNRQGSSCWSHVQGMPPYDFKTRHRSDVFECLKVWHMTYSHCWHLLLQLLNAAFVISIQSCNDRMQPAKSSCALAAARFFAFGTQEWQKGAVAAWDNLDSWKQGHWYCRNAVNHQILVTVHSV